MVSAGHRGGTGIELGTALFAFQPAPGALNGLAHRKELALVKPDHLC